MRSWRQTRMLRAVTEDPPASQSFGTLVSAGTDQAEGAWTQIVAATDFQYDHLCVQLANTIDQRFLTDLAVGAAASEQLIVDSMVSEAVVSNVSVEYSLPLRIPEGSRVSVRTQATGTGGGRDIVIALTGLGGSLRSDHVGASRIIEIGADTTNVGGTNIDPGAVANTKGSWSELVASLSDDLLGFALCLSKDGDVASDHFWRLDIGVGAGGSEQVVLPDIQLSVASAVNLFIPTHYNYIPLFLDAGQRIAARAQSSGTISGRDFEVHLLGFVR